MPDPAPQGKFVKLAGDGWAVDAHYHELGSGDDYVLFLQTGGAGTSAYMSWYLNLEPFAAAGYHVLAPDAPNFGLSAVPGGMTVPAPAFTVAFMEALGVGSAHLLGNSMGSMTSTRVAIDHPDRVTSLILTGGEPRVDTDQTREIAKTLGQTARMNFVREMLSKPELSLSDMNKATGDFFYDNQHQRVPEVSAMRLEDLRRPGVQERERAAAFRQIQGGRQNNAASDLATIKAPTCLIHGRDERYFFAADEAPILIEAAVKMSFVVPNASCFLLAQCGHWPQIEKSDMFNALSLEFLKQTGR